MPYVLKVPADETAVFGQHEDLRSRFGRNEIMTGGVPDRPADADGTVLEEGEQIVRAACPRAGFGVKDSDRGTAVPVFVLGAEVADNAVRLREPAEDPFVRQGELRDHPLLPVRRQTAEGIAEFHGILPVVLGRPAEPGQRLRFPVVIRRDVIRHPDGIFRLRRLPPDVGQNVGVADFRIRFRLRTGIPLPASHEGENRGKSQDPRGQSSALHCPPPFTSASPSINRSPSSREGKWTVYRSPAWKKFPPPLPSSFR